METKNGTSVIETDRLLNLMKCENVIKNKKVYLTRNGISEYDYRGDSISEIELYSTDENIIEKITEGLDKYFKKIQKDVKENCEKYLKQDIEKEYESKIRELEYMLEELEKENAEEKNKLKDEIDIMEQKNIELNKKIEKLQKGKFFLFK